MLPFFLKITGNFLKETARFAILLGIYFLRFFAVTPITATAPSAAAAIPTGPSTPV